MLWVGILHTYIHTYVHTYIHVLYISITCTHMHLHKYCTYTRMYTLINPYIHIVHTYIHTYCTFIHTKTVLDAWPISSRPGTVGSGCGAESRKELHRSSGRGRSGLTLIEQVSPAYTGVYVCMYMYVCMYVCTYAWVYVCVYVFIYSV